MGGGVLVVSEDECLLGKRVRYLTGEPAPATPAFMGFQANKKDGKVG